MRTSDEWRAILCRWRASGLGPKAFAEAEGLVWRTLQHWKYILARGGVGSPLACLAARTVSGADGSPRAGTWACARFLR